MSTVLHFINVGQGNMTLIQMDNGTIMVYDCNITSINENQVIGYLSNCIGWGTSIDIFVNSHRDADHMRGVATLNAYFPIKHVWDSGVTGGTPSSSEYQTYMRLRRQIGFTEVERRKRWTFGRTLLRIMNSKCDDLPNNANAQSIVIKVQHQNPQGDEQSSVLLTGDTDAQVWKDTIVDFYGSEISSDILLASHHGSNSFFDHPDDDQYYYVSHLNEISPAMTIISVGPNGHGHPKQEALNFYDRFTTGSRKGNKIKRTDQHGNIRLVLKDEGGWTNTENQ